MSPSLEHDLRQLLGDAGVSGSQAARDRYASDALRPGRGFPGAALLHPAPQWVVWPESVEQVQELLRLANRHQTPIVPYGGGSGLMGGAMPTRGGIVLDMGRMNRVLEVRPADRAVTAEAGTVLQDVNAALAPHGLILGHDPWTVPVATVGGTISTDSLGYLGAAYGSMGDQVLGLQVVLPDGSLVETRAVPRRATGPHLERLFIGGEGCFGVITAATMRAVPLPERRLLAAYEFPGFDAGFRAVCAMFEIGLSPAMIDYGEELVSASPEGWGPAEPGAIMYLAFEGLTEVVEAQARRAAAICERFDGERQPDEVVQEFWDRRHFPAERFKQARDESGKAPFLQGGGGVRVDFLHMAVPASQVLPFKDWCLQTVAPLGVQVREFGLWNRPELFSVVLVDPDPSLPSGLDRLTAAADAILRHAQDVGGSMEYVHGAGIRLAHLMDREHGAGLQTLRAIKRLLDPNGILNPGKLALTD